MLHLRLLLVVSALGLGACTLAPQQPSPGDVAGRCERYFQALDETVATHEVGDAGAWRVPGFRHLRSTRFLAAFRDLPLDGAQIQAWLQRLRAVDAQARAVELANLPPSARETLQQQSPFATGHADSIARCGDVLIARDLTQPQRLASVRIRSMVPIHYRNWQRVLGLYPVSSYSCAAGSVP
ncbi:MAG: hypothetical protein OEN20_08370, partial [Gammaproteobacteria bacterium]|nr:hypothetical protein [Gammaproteobacteria bacterium]